MESRPGDALAGRLVSALFFFPRGGSAQVARSLCRTLPAQGWDVTLVSGSLGGEGDATDAATFFSGIDVRPVDYSRGARLDDPLTASVPFQPSYEDRTSGADKVFAAVGDLAYERLVDTWATALLAAGAADADLLHLHHLTPVNEAAARACPHVPVVGQLHGTELAMLRAIMAGAPRGWTEARAWAVRLRRWAQQCTRLLVPPALEQEASSLLGVPRERLTVAAGGVDLDRFERRPLLHDERLAFWRRMLVAEARGWDETGRPGTVQYRPAQLWPFRTAGTVFVFAGRYTAVKRLPLLIRAHARAQRCLAGPAPLVLVGGHPGEWEGEHPLAVARRERNEQVFLAGWWPHEQLADAMNAADVFVLPSAAESFGLALAEAMACGLPVIAADAYGPAQLVPEGAGWLVPPDDEEALADALVTAAADAAERRRRGALAYNAVRNRYGWPRIARRIASCYGEALGDESSRSTSAAGQR